MRPFPRQLRAVFVYGVEDKTAHQVTDGLSDTWSIIRVFEFSCPHLYTAVVDPTFCSVRADSIWKDQGGGVSGWRGVPVMGKASIKGSGGTTLSRTEVSSLPLNSRDFSRLLLLAAGMMTDTNGSANFTQQFTVSGQRGTAAVFAMDGADTSDPEMGGATFSNFNVDAIQEVQSSSGVMPADTGHRAAGFTNRITKTRNGPRNRSVVVFLRHASF